MKLYEILGLEPDATSNAVKAAYRQLSMKHHPDRHGGNADKFREVQQAYDVLGNEERRKIYDETGATGSPDHTRQKAEHIVADLLVQALAEVDAEVTGSTSMFDAIHRPTDPIKMAAATLTNSIASNLREQTKAKNSIKQLHRSLRRIKRSTGTNLVETALRGKLEQSESFLVKAAEELALFGMAQVVLKEYQYDRFAMESDEAPAEADALRLEG